MSTLFAVLVLGVAALPDGGAAPCPQDRLVDGCQRVLGRSQRRVGACLVSTERVGTAVHCDSSGEPDLHELERAWVTAPDGGIDREPRLAFHRPGCESTADHAEATRIDRGFMVDERITMGDVSEQREDGTPDLETSHELTALVVDAQCRFQRVALVGVFTDAASSERMVIHVDEKEQVTVKYSSPRRPTPQELEVTAWTPKRLAAEVRFKDGSRYRLAFDAEGVVVTPVKQGAPQRFVPAKR